jgi:multidrug resistance protein MdtO
MVGILLGVLISTVIQTLVWPEGEAHLLRQKLAALLRSIAGLVGARAPGEAEAHLRATGALAECEAMLARVALEPGWQEGGHEHATLRAQAVLAQARELLLAGDALQAELSVAAEGPGNVRAAARALQEQAVVQLQHYADELAANPPTARSPSRIDTAALALAVAAARGQGVAGERAEALRAAAEALTREIAGLPDWLDEIPAARLEEARQP